MSYLIILRDLVYDTDTVFTKPTDLLTYKQDFNRVFMNVDISNIYEFEVDECTREMFIFKMTDKLIKGWVFNTNRKIRTNLYKLSLIKINMCLESAWTNDNPDIEDVNEEIKNIKYIPCASQTLQDCIAQELKLKFTTPNFGLSSPN